MLVDEKRALEQSNKNIESKTIIDLQEFLTWLVQSSRATWW